MLCCAALRQVVAELPESEELKREREAREAAAAKKVSCTAAYSVPGAWQAVERQTASILVLKVSSAARCGTLWSRLAQTCHALAS